MSVFEDFLTAVYKMFIRIPKTNLFNSDVNDKMEERSRKEHFLDYLDHYDTFKEQPGLYYKDGLHLSDNGSKQLAKSVRLKINVSNKIIILFGN